MKGFGNSIKKKIIKIKAWIILRKKEMWEMECVGHVLEVVCSTRSITILKREREREREVCEFVGEIWDWSFSPTSHVDKNNVAGLELGPFSLYISMWSLSES